MVVGRDSSIGAGLVVGAAILVALGNWDTVTNRLPADVRSYLESPVTAIILGLVGVYFLWRAARAAEDMARDASAARQVAEQSNRELQRRVEAAEAKLVKAIDEKQVDWTPAFEAALKKHTEALAHAHRDYTIELNRVARNHRTEIMVAKGAKPDGKGIPFPPEPKPDDRA